MHRWQHDITAITAKSYERHLQLMLLIDTFVYDCSALGYKYILYGARIWENARKCTPK